MVKVIAFTAIFCAVLFAWERQEMMALLARVRRIYFGQRVISP
jgi:hypothetical protein